MRRLKILTWHLHGAYLYYLTQAPHDFHVLSKPGRPPGYAGRFGHIPWGDNVHDMPVDALQDAEFDCVLYQDDPHWLRDRHTLLTEGQRRLPSIYLEHDPPLDHPTEQRHFVDSPDVLLVHVTPFNALMWDSGRCPTRMIDHGVIVPEDVRYSGELARGLVVINHPMQRGRRLGGDVYLAAQAQVPLDLVGMATEDVPGGLGEVIHRDLPAFEARYRFFFNPIRYTSMGLAVIEAMMVGLPIVGLATTEMAMAIRNGESGVVDTDPARLVEAMRGLLADPGEARRLGEGARRHALERFGIRRFVHDWNATFLAACG